MSLTPKPTELMIHRLYQRSISLDGPSACMPSKMYAHLEGITHTGWLRSVSVSDGSSLDEAVRP